MPPTATGSSSRRWTGRSRSAGGAPPTCGPSSPPGPGQPIPGPPGTRWCWTCPPSRSARWPTTPSESCHDRRLPTAAGPRPGRRAAAAQAGRDAPPRPRAADHREDPAVGPRGTAAHPGRGRDHRPGRLQRPDQAQGRRVPGDQDPRGVRPRRVHDPRRHAGLPGLPGMGHRPRESLPGRPGRHRQEPPPGRARHRRRRRPGTKSATSPPPSWPRPSTAAWPTTPSGASSTPCSATT